MARCNLKAASIGLVTAGVLVLVLAFIAVPTVNMLVHSQIKADIPISSESSLLYPLWENPKDDVSIIMTYYLYNCTNPHEVKKNGAMPNISAVGPFSYIERRVKWNVEFVNNRTALNYVYNRTFHYIDTPCNFSLPLDSQTCSLPEDTKITIINVPLMGILSQLGPILSEKKVEREAEALAVEGILDLYGEDLFTTREMYDIVFGYNDPFLQTIADIEEYFNEKLHKNITIQSPQFVLQYNNSELARTKVSQVATGKGNPSRVLEYNSWEELPASYSGFWRGCPNTPEGLEFRRQCNMLNGTEGFQFPPLLGRNTSIYTYAEDLRRTSRLVHTDDITFKGIDAYRYRIAPECSMNVSQYPPNCGFNNFGPSGVLNLTDVVIAPVFASKPSFLDADPYYFARVNGLETPDRAKHDTYTDVEPLTGSGLDAHQRLQVNGQVQKSDDFVYVRHIMDGGFYYPILHADEHAQISDHLANTLKNRVFLPIKAAKYLKLSGWGVGGLLLAIGAVVVLRWRRATAIEKSQKAHRQLLESDPLLGGYKNKDDRRVINTGEYA